MEIKIGSRIISAKNKPYFIADIAANHDGDLNRAYKLIELAKESGADAAKFQNFKASAIVSRKGFDSLGRQLSHQASWKKSVYQVYEEASISDEWTPLLKEKCDQLDIEYMTSPYDFDAVDLAEQYVRAFKIGSGDITWIEILEYIANKNKPILLATGASALEDVKRAVEAIKKQNSQIVLLQCNTNYTLNSENFRYLNLNVLNTYKELFPECLLGLSDHTQGYVAVLGAVALGARVIEKHFTDDNKREGPDHRFSMNPEGWREMVKATQDLFDALGDGIKRVEGNETEAGVVQRRSLYYTRDISAGACLAKDDVFPVRPAIAGSIEPYRLQELIGKAMSRAVYQGEQVKEEDFVNAGR